MEQKDSTGFFGLYKRILKSFSKNPLPCSIIMVLTTALASGSLRSYSFMIASGSILPLLFASYHSYARDRKFPAIGTLRLIGFSIGNTFAEAAKLPALFFMPALVLPITALQFLLFIIPAAVAGRGGQDIYRNTFKTVFSKKGLVAASTCLLNIAIPLPFIFASTYVFGQGETALNIAIWLGAVSLVLSITWIFGFVDHISGEANSAIKTETPDGSDLSVNDPIR